MRRSRRIGPLTSGAALSLLLLATACGGGGGGTDGGGGEGTEEQSESASLGGDGFLALSCDEGSITVARFSDQDGSLQAEHVFTAADATSAEEPALPSGRTVDNLKSVTLPDCETGPIDYSSLDPEPITRNRAHELAGLVIPDHSLLLVTLVEEVDGADVTTIGAMSADGRVEALLPVDDASGFSGASDKLSPRYYHPDGTVFYLESGSDGSRTVMSLAPESGDVQEVGPCDESCERVIVDPYSGVVYGTGLNLEDPDPDTPEYYRYFSHHDASVVGYSGISTFSYINFRVTQGEGTPIVSRSPGSSPIGGDGWQNAQHNLGLSEEYPGVYPVFMVGEYEVMLDDNAFTVRAFDPEELASESEDSIQSEDRQILPGNTRTNEHPVLSADRSQILFRSTDGSGNVSWFSTPVAGGAEPTEIGLAEGGHGSMVPIHWF
ncbi:hypothetical protein [Nocardiopsis halotolerans]|uniref:hypothetical protein n=1 Tax=Nocardiopsis halotolerans TaxID=124252 RepID=UPI00034D6D06|nr:hypothetical protein [Nocardiopsis halotolerans]